VTGPSIRRLPVHRPEVGTAESARVSEVLEHGWFGRGPVTEEFEAVVAELVGAAHLVAVVTGTAAVQLALEAVGVGPGDEVVLPSLTFAATYQAVRAVGATPRFAEVDPAHCCLDPEDVRARLSGRTRAVLTVHYGGWAGARGAIAELADEHGLVLVEDAAHAVGSVGPDGRPVGATGNPVCFSFDPVKSLTCGQGGAVAVGDPDLAARLRALANLGFEAGVRHRVAGPGWRYQMGDLNAAIGLAQAEDFARRAARRRELWRRYAAGLVEVDGVGVLAHDPDRMVPFLFAVRVAADRRDGLRRALHEQGIDTAVHYEPGHRQPWGGEAVELPATERVAAELLTLPFFVGLTDDDVDRVVGAVRSWSEGS